MFCRNCGKDLTGTPEICLNCGAKPLAGSNFCHACGAQTNPSAVICTKCGAGLTGDISPKSRLATTLFAVFLGGLGAHRFYVGKTGTAITMLILGILGWATVWILIGYIFLVPVHIWAFIDFIFTVAGKFTDSKGKLIQNW